MGDLSNAKTLGGIGALLSLVGGAIPYAGPIVSILGLVMVFIAVKSISETTNKEDIFNNYLYHFLLSIISIIALFMIMLIGFGAIGGFTWIQTLQDIEITNFESFWNYFGEFMIYLLIALFVAWILTVIGSVYLRRSYNQIAEETNINLFRTTGTLYFFGAITLIVLIGFLLLLVARVLEIIAYFSLPDELPGDKASGRRCPNCDRVIPEDSMVCPYCGKNF